MTYNESIFISGVRKGGANVSATVPARALDDGVADDVSADMRGANLDMMTFFVRIADWPETLPPQAGDTVMRDSCETRFKVGRVTRLGDCFAISARSR